MLGSTRRPHRSLTFIGAALVAAITACAEAPLGPDASASAQPGLDASTANATAALPALAVGYLHNCVVTAGGSVVCWGSNEAGQSDAPAGEFVQVSANYRQSCGVKSDGTLACWGDAGHDVAPPEGAFTQVSLGSDHACALRADGDIVCWGQNYEGQVSGTPTRTLPFEATFTHEGSFVQVSAGLYHTCALTAEGQAVCWGRNDVGAIMPPAGTYTQLAATWYRTCGLRTDGAIVCWGNNGNGQGNTPAGVTFTQVAANGFHTCGVTTDGDVMCWGYDGWGQVSGAPGELMGAVATHEGPFASVGTGMYHTCGVKTDGSIVCWGAGTTNTGIEPHLGQSMPPQLQQAQAIAFTSNVPVPAVLGASYTVTATGGGSGNPVVFTSLTPTTCTVGSSSDGVGTVTLRAVGTCTIAADQAGSAGWLPAPRVTQSVAVVYDFGSSTGGGFGEPVSSTTLNKVRAGQAVPIKFDLGGDQGLGVIASGYPQSIAVACPNGSEPVNVLPVVTETPGSSTLSYDARTGLYGYVWKTDRAWAGTCREFVLKLADGMVHTARFQFAR